MLLRQVLFALFGSLVVSTLASGCASSTPDSRTARSEPAAAAETLRFSEFFVLPVGPRGLEPTAKLLGLGGKRVLIEGFVVVEEEPRAGSFLLTPVPVTLADRGDGPADFLPPATLFVHLPDRMHDERARFLGGAWQLTGTLELGAAEEEDGRVSYVRLLLDQGSPVERARGSARNPNQIATDGRE